MKHYICIILFSVVSFRPTFAQTLPKSLEALLEQGQALYVEQKYIQAAEAFDLLITKGKESQDSLLLANIYYSLGRFYDNKRNHNKSLEFLFKGTNILGGDSFQLRSNSTQGPIVSHIPKRSLSPSQASLASYIYKQIGGVYYNQKNYKKAERYWQKSYTIAKEYKLLWLLSAVLNNLGEVKRFSHQPYKALSLYKQALGIKQIIKDSIGIHIISSNIGTTHLAINQLDSAKHFYDKNYLLALAINDPRILLSSYSDYGLHARLSNKVSKALYWYNRVLPICEQLDDRNLLLPIYQDLSDLYAKQNRFDSSLYFQKKWITLTQIINKEHNEKLALEIEAKFLINEKEREFDFLQKESKLEQQKNQLKDYFQWASIIGLFSILAFTLVILKLRNKNHQDLKDNILKINQKTKEKDILLKEIHHRVKNNLQVITSLLSLQSYNLQDSNMKELFRQSQHRINSMAMIHEMLYQSNDFSKINYNSYLNQLVTKLVTSFKGIDHQIEIKIDVPDLFLNIDTAVPLGLLINEIITNALKYGFPDQMAGTLYIKMQVLDPPNFLLEIGDNGIGFPEDINKSSKHSLGLNLIQQLAVQLNGNIQKDPNKKGTNYKLHFQEIE